MLSTEISERKTANQKLRELTRQIDRDSFKMFDFDYQGLICYNYRLQTVGGRYTPRTDRIEMNPKMRAFGRDKLVSLIKHELCHYYVFHTLQGAQPHGKEFKYLLHEVGGSRYAPQCKRSCNYLYKCQKCGMTYPRQRRVDTGRYVCGKCQGKLRLVNNAR